MKSGLLALLCVLLSACSGTPRRGSLLILRFENLSGDSSFDWMGRGAAREIAAQLDDAVPADSLQPDSDRERGVARGVTRILHGYFTRSGDKLRLHADLEDTATGKFPWSAESSGPASAGITPLAQAVARQLDPNAQPRGAKNEAALAAYVAALDAPDSELSSRSLFRAIQADPDFGAAYLTLVQLSRARQDSATAQRVIEMARARGAAISTLDRARLEVASAQLSGDPAALSKSLAMLARLTPGDSALLGALAASELAAKRYLPAIDYFRKALAAQSGDAQLMNSLGYAQAYAGDLDGAVQTLREYERLNPTQANPLDSLGDVYFYFGRFSEAERLYNEEYTKDRMFIGGVAPVKAATAHLMTGDAAGADAAFAAYEKSRIVAHDPSISLRRAEWDSLRGRRREAIRGLEALAASTKLRDLASAAHSELVIWSLEAGDSARARQHAVEAMAAGAGRPSAVLAALCRSIADPAVSPTPLGRAYALLFEKNFKAALPLLRERDKSSSPSPADGIPVLLAWALIETGHIDEAEKYLRFTPVPSVPEPGPFESLIYPRIFHLRGIVAQRKGAGQVAEQNEKLFQLLSPPQTEVR